MLTVGLLTLLLPYGEMSSLRAAELRKISFGYSTIGAMATGGWMAKEIGAFEKYGLQADVVYIGSGPLFVQALIGGNLHGGIGASSPIINSILNGASIVGVAGTAQRPYHRLWVQPEITRVEELRGKTLGVTRFGSMTDNLTRILLRRYGLENAVQIRQLGGSPEVGAAFQQRAIVGSVTSDLRVGDHVPAKVLVNMVDFGIPYSMNMIPVFRDYYRRHPEIVEGMVRAYTEGVAALHHDKPRALKVIAKYSRRTNAKQLEDHYQDSVTYLERIPRVEPESVATILEFEGKKNVPVESFFDNSIVDRMVREGFIDRLYKQR
jgi:ABC-type nitrate/sulfonate/bicarbonate transport system substrate-binding protein